MKRFPQVLFGPYLDPGEEVLEVFHRHPFIIITGLAKILFFYFLIPFFLIYLFPEFTLFFGLWIFIGVIRLVRLLFNWYHDAIILTNVSLIKTYGNGLFNRTSTRLEYPMIEGISYAIQGLRKTIFNYGHVTVVRSGNASAVELSDAMNPPNIERLVLHYQEKFVSDQNLKDSSSLKDLLVSLVRHHAKTQGTNQNSSQQKK
jgi:hypothetical protein